MKKFVSVRDVIEMTSLSERMIRKLIADGKLKVVRPAGMRVVRIEENEVKRLMQTTPRGNERAAP